MATVPTEIAAGTPRGITNTLSGYVVETESITPADRSEEVPDQKAAIADEIHYDTRTDLRLTVRSATTDANAPTTAGTTDFSYADKKWKVDSVEEAGSYNGLRRWNINAHKYENWPPQPTPSQNNQTQTPA